MSLLGGMFADDDELGTYGLYRLVDEQGDQLAAQEDQLAAQEAQLAAQAAQLAAQKAVLDAHDEWAHDIVRIGLEAYATLSELHELADKIRSRKPS